MARESDLVPRVSEIAQLPADIDALHVLVAAARAERDVAIVERDHALSQIDRLRHLLRQLQRAQFGRRSEKLDPEQLLLALEDIEQAIAGNEAADDKKDPVAARARSEKRRANRGALPIHLPRVDVTIEPEDTNCPCCRAPMHVIGEETSQRLDVIPAQFRVVVTHPPAVAYSYAPGRGAVHALKLLEHYRGIVQCDGDAAYKSIADAACGEAITLAFCWAHLRRRLFDIAKDGSAPIASEALERIAALYAIEKTIRGHTAFERRAVRQEQSKPLVLELKRWFEQQLARVSGKSLIAEAIRYGLNHWDGLTRFLDDGRIELDTNIVERSIRPLVLNRKNALFAGHDQGSENSACIASLIENCKLHGVDAPACFSDVLTKLVNLWPASRLDELMPWAWAAERSSNKLAA